MARDPYGLVEQTAGVVAYVEDKLLHALFAKALKGFFQLVGCGLREAARESDVADAGPYHVGVADGGLWDEAALDCEEERGLTARALDLDGDRLAFGAAHGLRHFRRRPVARVTSVNL